MPSAVSCMQRQCVCKAPAFPAPIALPGRLPNHATRLEHSSARPDHSVGACRHSFQQQHGGQRLKSERARAPEQRLLPLYGV